MLGAGHKAVSNIPCEAPCARFRQKVPDLLRRASPPVAETQRWAPMRFGVWSGRKRPPFAAVRGLQGCCAHGTTRGPGRWADLRGNEADQPFREALKQADT